MTNLTSLQSSNLQSQYGQVEWSALHLLNQLRKKILIKDVSNFSHNILYLLTDICILPFAKSHLNISWETKVGWFFRKVTLRCQTVFYVMSRGHMQRQHHCFKGYKCNMKIFQAKKRANSIFVNISCSSLSSSVHLNEHFDLSWTS